MVGILLEDALVKRGLQLEADGRLDEAKHAFRTSLRRSPANAEALNGLGRVLYREGLRRSARRFFERLVARHPSDAAGHTNLGIVLLESDEVAAARAHFEHALQADPSQQLAHFGLARIAALEGNDAAALHHQQAVTRGARRDGAPPVTRTRAPKLLLLSSEEQLGAVGAAPLSASDLSLATLIVEHADAVLPAHHAIFNTITDADRNPVALRIAHDLVSRSDAPVINHPSAVLHTARESLPAFLAGIEDAVLARTLAFERALLLGADAEAALRDRGFGWPLLLRAKGYHSGQHFVRVEDPSGLSDAARELPGDELLAIEYLDAQSSDGAFRKYRVMIVDGKLYPLHLAVSPTWKVHYFSAGMAQRADWRAEDAAFLSSMVRVLPERSLAALESIATRLALDYAGIDFALDPLGRVLVFEANATMTVPSPPSDPRWDYRRTHVQRILSATRRMLWKRARAGGWR